MKKNIKNNDLYNKNTNDNNILVKDIVKCWENNNILINYKTNNLYKFVDAINKCDENSIDIKFQKFLEKKLLSNKNLSYLKLFFSKNKIMKKFYNTVKENLENEFKRWEKAAIMSNVYFTKILNNTLLLTYGFFEALASCIKLNNYLYNTLYTKIYNYILHDFIISSHSSYKYNLKCDKCDIKIDIDPNNIFLVDCVNCNMDVKTLKFSNIEELNVFCINSNKSLKKIKKKEHIKFNKYQASFVADKICVAIEYAGIIKKELDKEQKANVFVINNDLKKYLDQYIITIMFKPPMVVKPKPWKSYNKDAHIMYEGGYYNNLFLKINITFDKKIYLNAKFKKALNFIQNVPLKINKKYLNYLLSLNINEIVKELQTISEDHFMLYLKGDIILIPSDKLNIINEFASTLYFSKLFSKFNKIYIPMHYDFRGRIYCSSYPLNYHSHSIYRGLYTFSKKKKIDNLNNFYEFFRSSSGDKKLFDKFLLKQELYSKKDFYLYKSINFNKDYSMIGVDACSSTFQIQGLLTKDLLMMKYCNMLSHDEKLDLYKFVMDNAYKDIKNNIELNKLWKLTNNENKLIFDQKEKFDDFLNELYNDRKLWKGCIMKLGYNQQTKSRSQEITDHIVENYLKILNKKNKSLLKLTFFLAIQLEKTFNRLFESQLNLKKFMSKAATIITKKKEYIAFKTNKFSHKVWQSYHKPKYQERWFNNKYTSKKIHVRFAIYDEDTGIDKNKIKIATLPNLIQYYDSSILINFLLECHKQKLDVKTIHDNFLGHYENLNEFRTIYYTVLSKTLLSRPDPLWVFIEINNLQSNKIIIKLYNNIMKNYAEAMIIDKSKKYTVIYKKKYYKFIENFLNENNKWILSW